MNFEHIPVLLEEVVEGLKIAENGIYVDGTLGGAGHSTEILKRLKYGKLVGIDQDLNAISKAKMELEKFEDKVIIIHDNFINLDSVLDKLGIEKVDGILFDLGVSSHQLDEGERGFSYQTDAMLDMRMDTTQSTSAWDVVNKYSESELEKILWEFGEERWAKRIAEFMVLERKTGPINTTFDLVSVIKKAIPKGARQTGHHPAKKTFQAIRIEVNRELDILKEAVIKANRRLKSGGRICVITFHSLEDRIVKDTFKELNQDCICPKEFPVCMCDKKRELKIITRKPILPSKEEIENNPRSRSAKLRIGEKV